MRLTPPPEVEEVPGQFWKDFIRDTAPVFRRADDRAARGVHRPDLPGADRRRPLRRRPPARDHRRGRARPASSRTTSSPSRPCSPAAGRGRGSSPATRPRSRTPTSRRRSPACRRPIAAAGRSSGTPTASALGEMHADFSEFCQERGAPPLPADDFIHESPLAEPLPLSRSEVDYRRATPARRRAGTTSRRASAATDPDWELPPGLAEREGPLVYLSLGSLGSADVSLMREAGRRAGRRALPGDRLQGPPGGRVRARRQHDRRGVPAADRDPAPGRPGDHPRRQQHRHRVALLRQADGRACRSSGTSTTTPSASTRPGSASASTPTATTAPS